MTRVGRIAAALGLVVLAAGLASADAPPRYVVDAARSAIGFHATSRFMDADGRFARFAGELALDPARPEAATARMTVEVASLDTGIGLRDNHLRSDDFFAVARYPTATFVLTGASRADGRWEATGALTIRGVTRRVTVPVALHASGGTLRVAGELTIDRHDFGISYRSFLNPIGDRVRIAFDLVAVPG